ncbi:MAG: hypothetical protein HQM10_21455 [Candidatus Riflebacteria bacterium]|nr:hypothetical protein [Candidatus Riflebacteria bacterium]
MSGSFTPQPLEKNGSFLFYNGEIYNYQSIGKFSSDSEAILSLYNSEGISGLAQLDGEFAICIIDTKKGEMVLATDTFGTKPLHISKFGGYEWGVSSLPSLFAQYPSKRFKPNHIMRIRYSDLHVLEELPLKNFSLKQYKTNYDDFFLSIVNSMKKRTNMNPVPFVPISSGIDSGTIAATLDEIGVPFVSSTFLGHEDLSIIKARIEKRKGPAYVFPEPPKEVIESYRIQFENEVDDFYYGPNNELRTRRGKDDPGALALFILLLDIKQRHPVQVVLSGQGGDEIMGTIQTYTFGKPNPSFFPENLAQVFPWENFFQGANSSYLLKEENIASNFGIETRYPLLDFDVVQEFLYLVPALKNPGSKRPLSEYLKSLNYPHNSLKAGFSYVSPK